MSVTMSPSLRTRIGSAALAVGIAAALGLATVPTASAASNSFIAAPNGMVGVSEIITIKAPTAVGQVVTIGLQIGAAALTQIDHPVGQVVLLITVPLGLYWWTLYRQLNE